MDRRAFLGTLAAGLATAGQAAARCEGYAPGVKGVDALRAAAAAAASSLGNVPFAAVVDDFYLTNPIARASRTMAECSALATSLDTAVAAE